ncbi:MotA/TolQ/ExbB proton channel family protein [Pseudomonas japonica]|uniref:MotA/TolQ/ExbB proton channel family protein n=1 Tax=Pseudomonas japonica TaxID=256466 RepID=UPI0015E372E7|nr:MotA/TolQ/ExbB proton channel family protein [Pseudomonas japonica]MBA1245870.1 hypothetical protein [Pseudomonas japonica]
MKANEGLIYQVRSWFVLALLLKIVSATLSYYTQDPFWFGFVIPLAVMFGYCIVGFIVHSRYDINLTTAKFADSAYYLGFLFTVGSIIVCLADIQSIGDNLSGMAARFATAMISTAIGMVARTLLVGFKQDQDDATKAVEERAIHASQRLVMMFDETYTRLEHFRDQVVGTGKETTAAVKEQIEDIQKHSIAAMDAYFSNATQRSNETFDAMLKDAKSASEDLLVTINGLADKSEKTLERMESHALDFGNLATRRLEQTLFPDDLFANKLNPAIETLATTTEGVNSSIATLADDVKGAARAVGTAIRGLNTKTQALEDTLSAVNGIVEGQQRLMDSMNGQGSALLEGIERAQASFLDKLVIFQAEYRQELASNREAMGALVGMVSDLNKKIEDDDSSAALSQELEEAFQAIGESNQRAHEAFANSIKSTLVPLIEAIVDSTATHKDLANKVIEGSSAVEAAHSQLEDLARKIDHINQIELRQPAVNEPVMPAEAEPIEASAIPHSPDVRPA